eukprot:1669296-Prymnesium_polylepis.1
MAGALHHPNPNPDPDPNSNHSHSNLIGTPPLISTTPPLSTSSVTPATHAAIILITPMQT